MSARNSYIQNKGNNKITELEQSYKGKVQTHNYINRQNQSTTGKRTALTTILPILFLYLNTVTVTAGTFEPL
jgi:hypothetical protein